MFVLVTVGAEQFPIAAIRWVVVVVIVLVMHFQQWQIGMIERARATATDLEKQFQRLCPVTLFPFFGATLGLKDKTIKATIGLCHRSHCFSVEGTQVAVILTVKWLATPDTAPALTATPGQ